MQRREFVEQFIEENSGHRHLTSRQQRLGINHQSPEQFIAFSMAETVPFWPWSFVRSLKHVGQLSHDLYLPFGRVGRFIAAEPIKRGVWQEMQECAQVFWEYFEPSVWRIAGFSGVSWRGTRGE